MILTACVFDDADGARHAARTLQLVDDATGLACCDCVIVGWPRDDRLPRSEILRVAPDEATRSRAFWSLLMGMTFSVPLLDAAVGSAAHAETGALSAVGVTPYFMNRLRDEVTPGRSALVFLSGEGGDSWLRTLTYDRDAPLAITAQLSAPQEAALLEVFAS
jgi:uncharacterized membrane protein